MKNTPSNKNNSIIARTQQIKPFPMTVKINRLLFPPSLAAESKQIVPSPFLLLFYMTNLLITIK